MGWSRLQPILVGFLVQIMDGSVVAENQCEAEVLRTPDRSTKLCTDGNNVGSVCTFTCDRHHSMIGPVRSVCLETPRGPRWTHPTPICEPDVCDPPRKAPKNGTVICTDGNLVDSFCTFKCLSREHSLHPSDAKINKCLPKKEWDNVVPCCAAPCQSPMMDAFFVLDSSSSLGTANWEIVKTFVRGIIASFIISDDGTHFAVVRYNRIVDTATQILLNDFPNDKAGLLAAFDRIPYDGAGTLTGNALSYVLNTMLNIGNRYDAQDVVIVLTDGRSQDDVLEPSNELRRRGVVLFVIGVQPPRGQLDQAQLLDIGGDQSNVLIAESFQELDQGFAVQIGAGVCQDPCQNQL